MSSYFSTGSGKPQGSVSVVGAQSLRRFPLADGITIEPVLGARLNINLVRLEPGAVAIPHSHDEEQIGYVVSGNCTFTDGEQTWSLGPGDCYHAPPNAPHGATAGPDGCVIVDAFAPPRAGVAELLDAP